MGKEAKRDTWESLKEDGNKLFAHRKYEQGKASVLNVETKL